MSHPRTPRTGTSDSAGDGATLPRPRNAAGLELDAHGLPINGPARIAALAGKPDPAEALDLDAPAPKARDTDKTEKDDD